MASENEEYRSLYRKYRPVNLGEIKGQDPIVRTLTNALSLNRIAHAYLFSGPRGTGKTSTAKILAACLNCVNGDASPDEEKDRRKIKVEPCGVCSACQKIRSGFFLDVLEIDAASNRGIDEIRELRERVKFTPVEGRYKVYIIDEVHMLTNEAFNALLKTLEEPPEHAVFILATTELHKVPQTIISRCQCFDFKAITLEKTIEELVYVADKEGIEIDDSALQLLARSAQGGMRDALGLLEQAIAFSRGKITADKINALLGLTDKHKLVYLADCVLKKDESGALKLVEDLLAEGQNLQHFLKDCIEHFRNLLFIKIVADPRTVLQLTEEEFLPLQEQSLKFRKENLERMIKKLFQCQNEIKYALNERWTLEMGLLDLFSAPASELEKRLALLEEKLENQAFVVVDQKDIPAQEKEEIQEETGWSNLEPPPLEDEFPVSEAPSREVKEEEAFTPDELDEIWPLFLEKLKSKKRTFHAYILAGTLEGVSGNKIYISYGEKNLFHKDNAGRPEVQEMIQDIMKNDFHKDVKFVLIKEGENVPKAEKSTSKNKGVSAKIKEVPKKEKPLKEEKSPLLEKALEFFGGEIIEEIKE